MHFKRWITAIIAIPALIYLIGFGPRWGFYLLLLLISLLGLSEFYKITSPNLPKLIIWPQYFTRVGGVRNAGRTCHQPDRRIWQ